MRRLLAWLWEDPFPRSKPWVIAWVRARRRPIRTGPSPAYRVWRDREYGR